jgi:hypothetical protein
VRVGRYGAVLAIVLVIVACGCASSAAPPSASPSRIAIDPGARGTPIWAGYETLQGATRSITATWIQPDTPSPTVGHEAVSIWVGLVGKNAPTVEQVGSDGYVAADEPGQSDGFYEMFPKPSVVIDQAILTVSPGNLVTASVTNKGHGRFILELVNHATGQSYLVTKTSRGVGSTRAAIIIEGPSQNSVALASFGSVRFTDCRVDDRPLGQYPVARLEIVRNSGSETRTSALSAGGESFSVSRR